MALRSWFILYRPTAPSTRAQSIQVIHAAHALAERGHRVTLWVQPPPGARPTPTEVLDAYGLAPTPGLRLGVLPAGRTGASLAHRAAFVAWLARNPGGIVLARSKRYAQDALRWFGGRFRLVLEVHEVDSAQQAERGQDPQAMWTLERRVLGGAAGVVANCPGTLALLRATHANLPPAVALHNATHPGRIRRPTDPGEDIGYVGSLLVEKDLETLARAAARLPQRIVLVGPSPGPAWDELLRLSRGRLVREDALPHRAVPDRLARFRTLVLPLGTGLFGDQLTSPLKLWDYLAAGRPIAGADTPALRSAAPPGSFAPWTPGDPASLVRVLTRLDRDEALRTALLAAARVRTWAERAAELEAFVDDLP